MTVHLQVSRIFEYLGMLKQTIGIEEGDSPIQSSVRDSSRWTSHTFPTYAS